MLIRDFARGFVVFEYGGRMRAMSDKPPITSFTGQYRFLSNFYLASVEFGGLIYPTVEHAYQASKTTDNSQHRLIQKASSPGAAKRLGKKVVLHRDFENVKTEIMLKLVRQKFENHSHLRNSLLRTGDRMLIEANSWGDRFWGESPVGLLALSYSFYSSFYPTKQSGH